MSEVPEGSSASISPGVVGVGVGVNQEPAPPVEGRILHTVVIMGKPYHRIERPDGTTFLAKA